MINTIELKKYLADESISEYGRNVFIQHNRKRENVIPRQSAMYVLLHVTKLSLREIGYICSNGKAYDHATVLYANKKTMEERDRYDDRKDSINFWYNSIGRFLLGQKNEYSKIYPLLQKVESTLQLSEDEIHVLLLIRKLVKKEVDKINL